MGQARSEADNKKNTSQGNFKNISYAISSMCGWRLYMEDADIAQSPLGQTQFSLFGVFDGHGGPQVSAYVKRHFAEQLLLNKYFKQGNYSEALRTNFLKMDEIMLSEQGQKQLQVIHKQMVEKGNTSADDDGSHAGCTANVVLITPTHIYCANSGDSRAVASVKSAVTPLSFDHKPQDQIEIDRIQKAGGQIYWGRVNGNLNLTRALGDFQYKKNQQIKAQQQIITANPDVKQIENKNVDFIIMGCDGIWQVKQNKEMVEWVQSRLSKRKRLTDIVEQLLDELVSKNGGNQFGMDNMSSMLIKFEK